MSHPSVGCLGLLLGGGEGVVVVVGALFFLLWVRPIDPFGPSLCYAWGGQQVATAAEVRVGVWRLRFGCVLSTPLAPLCVCVGWPTGGGGGGGGDGGGVGGGACWRLFRSPSLLARPLPNAECGPCGVAPVFVHDHLTGGEAACLGCAAGTLGLGVRRVQVTPAQSLDIIMMKVGVAWCIV